ncbi:MAG TPA: hypothetical protein VGR16_08420 [Thermomicrobiales bacterium]|nr:hypothetical protein [Thermomicrobiales bacterium]
MPNALTAAAHDVFLIALESHLRSVVADAIEEDDGEAVIAEMVAILRKTLRP